MTIAEIYKKYSLPPNLQEHMLRVCAVADFMHSHWKNIQKVDWNIIYQAALLHDIGNIVDFDFTNHPEFLGPEQKNLARWKKVQEKMINKYGKDDHKATATILSELGISKKLIDVIQQKTFTNSLQIKSSDNWITKILSYADIRTLPFGIGTLENRMQDVRKRMPNYTARADFEDLVAASFAVEQQIQENLDVSVSAINNDSIKIDRKFLQLVI